MFSTTTYRSQLEAKLPYNLANCVGSTSEQVDLHYMNFYTNLHCMNEFDKTTKAYVKQCKKAIGTENKKAVVEKAFDYMGKCQYKWETKHPKVCDAIKGRLVEFSKTAPPEWIAQRKESLMSRITFD